MTEEALRADEVEGSHNVTVDTWLARVQNAFVAGWEVSGEHCNGDTSEVDDSLRRAAKDWARDLLYRHERDAFDRGDPLASARPPSPEGGVVGEKTRADLIRIVRDAKREELESTEIVDAVLTVLALSSSRPTTGEGEEPRQRAYKLPDPDCRYCGGRGWVSAFANRKPTHIEERCLNCQYDPTPAGDVVEAAALAAFDALDVADRLIERAYGTDVPPEWTDAFRGVAAARALSKLSGGAG